MSYVGDIKDRLRHGHGVYSFPGDYYKYTGEWRRGKMHGHGIFLLGDGSTYEGNFTDGEIEGNGIRRWVDGTTYTGDFHRGEMHGEGIRNGTILPHQSKVYTSHQVGKNMKALGKITDSMVESYGELLGPDDSSYEGYFENHQPHGMGKKTYPDGSVYDGNWINGQWHGLGKWTASDGAAYEGEWCQDKRNGFGKGTWPSGFVYEGTWTLNIRDKNTKSFSVLKMSDDGVPDPSPLIFREESQPTSSESTSEDNSQVNTPSVKLLPIFQIECLSEDLSNQGVVITEESYHGIRVSLFYGKCPQKLPEVEPEPEKKAKRNSVTDANLITENAPPSLIPLVDPATQQDMAEYIVQSVQGIATLPRLLLPQKALPGDYFLQFDSTFDAQSIPSAYFPFKVSNGDENTAKKDPKKK